MKGCNLEVWLEYYIFYLNNVNSFKFFFEVCIKVEMEEIILLKVFRVGHL